MRGAARFRVNAGGEELLSAANVDSSSNPSAVETLWLGGGRREGVGGEKEG